MKKNLPKSYIDCLPERHKCKSCIGCKNLSNPECGTLKSIRYNSGAVYTVKVPNTNCILKDEPVKMVNT